MTDLPQNSAESLTGPTRPTSPTGPAAHIPVLPEEVLAALSPAPGMVYCDATAGLGGTPSLIAPKLIPGGTVILNDVDPGNLERASARVRATLDALTGGSTVAIRTVRGNFARLPSVLGRPDRPDPLPPADLFLADLGFSSNQMDTAERGFSFMREGRSTCGWTRRSPSARATWSTRSPSESWSGSSASMAKSPRPHASPEKSRKRAAPNR